jgi:p-hydroxybenzoate 3-monooxygenase
MRTAVAIVGAGPAGLVLARLLELQGIESVIVEHRSQAHVEARVRAGILEHPTVELLRDVGLAERLDREGLAHDGFNVRLDATTHFLDTSASTGRSVTVYGQQELVKDAIALRQRSGGALLFDVAGVALDGLDTARPTLRCRHQGRDVVIEADVVAGCDGFFGVTRPSLPAGAVTAHQRDHPVAWLGILAASPPPASEGTYCPHERGMSLHSMRSPTVSRQYLEVPADTTVDDWTDAEIWDELRRRAESGPDFAIVEGPILERSVARLRSFVVEPMRWGNAFLLGDAAHIVPPTGAKGLNLAVGDACVLSHALGCWYATGDRRELDLYSERCLGRAWRAEAFAWTMTVLLHRLDGEPFAERIRRARLEALVGSPAHVAALAEDYVGTPFVTPWRWT